MPRYDLPKTPDGLEQWIELKDRSEITRKELRATRLAYDVDGGFVEKTEAHTELVLVNCLLNWQLYAMSGDMIPMVQKNVKMLRTATEALPIDTWLALEKAINGEDGEGGYTHDCLNALDKDVDPQKPSTV